MCEALSSGWKVAPAAICPMSSVIVATSPRPNGFAFSGTKVPAGPDWIHEVKRDGCRMLVVRENGRVRLLARNGYDRSDRYPWIVEAALKNPQKHFVIDGEAVVLGVDGTSDFDACIHASTMKRCSSMPSGAAHGRHLYCPIRARRDRTQTCFARAASWARRAWCRNTATAPFALADRPTGSRSKPKLARGEAGKGSLLK